MFYHLGINLAWPTTYSKMKKIPYFKHHIFALQTMGFSVFRIVFTSWSLNHHSSQGQQEILQILKFCKKNNLKVTLVLYHFTDFCDFPTREYFHYENKSEGMIISEKFTIELMSRIFEENLQSTIHNIELFNEVDLVSPKKQKRILQMLNLLLISLKVRFSFHYTISISNHLNKKRVQQYFYGPIELHTYSYPHETLLGNIKYMQKSNFFQQIGEYAKYSDEHRSILSSYVYFTAGLWAGALLGRQLSPQSRWWEEMIKDKNYKKILFLFQELFPNIPQLININYTGNPFVAYSSKSIIAPPYSKIKTRALNLLQNIKNFNHERGALKKFLYKLFFPSQKSDFLVFYSHENKYYILIETYITVTIEFQEIAYSQGYIIDLITKKKILFRDKYLASISPGCYLFVCR